MSGRFSLFPHLEFGNMTSDSRAVAPGDVFIAVRGLSHDGHRFLDQAVAQGARACVVQKGATDWKAPQGVEVAWADDTAASLSDWASEFYGHPSRALRVVGVTGTSGKTTTTFMVESVLREAGLRPGLIGTIVCRYAGLRATRTLEATHTTPDPIGLQALLAEMRDAGCLSVVMEVSSHALKQHRVRGVAFDAVGFTNLTPEHLDYHGTMDDYFESKQILFNFNVQRSIFLGKPTARIAWIAESGDWGSRMLSALPERLEGAGPTCRPQRSRWNADRRTQNRPGIEGTATLEDGTALRLQSPLIGAFNVENFLVAAELSHALGISTDVVGRGLSKLEGVPGRLERVTLGSGDEPLVLVDYAHKPDALEKVLLMLRERAPVVTVFGCGGDRDRLKRPRMGEIAQRLSHAVWITSDNPRTEDPQAIIREIQAGLVPASPQRASIHIEPDRKQAILKAVQSAQTGHTVLIAGKGHEDYQILGTQKVHLDDREIAREALALRQASLAQTPRSG